MEFTQYIGIESLGMKDGAFVLQLRLEPRHLSMAERAHGGRVGFTVSNAMDSVQFYVDGSAAGAAVTTNIPSGAARAVDARLWIQKSAGTTDRHLFVDTFGLWRDAR